MSRLLGTALLSITMPLVWASADMPSYRSVFDSYQPWQPDLPAPQWKVVNQQVQQLGGHMGHLRAVPAQTEQPATQQMNHHGKHEMHMQHKKEHKQ